ncbi:MAG: 30S ribosomal protein S6 [Patescibacteria group bacterium]
MKKYELLLVLPGTLDDKEAVARSEEVLKMVKEFSEEAELHVLGKSRLAYPIKQIRYGYFYTIVFKAGADQLKTLKGKLELSRDLLRAIISIFKTQLTASQKIVYATDSLGVTVMKENEEETAVKRPVSVRPRTVEIDLKDIDKKLDEILGQGDIIV